MQDLSQQFNPVPKFKEKRPKKSKKMQQFKGVKIPSRKTRGQICKKDYEKAMEYWGDGCAMTGHTAIEMHHVKFRSQGGRGSWRNLVPLVESLHKKCHQDRSHADYWREELESRFGKWYWADRFDLYKEGLIPNATHEAFEKFMIAEQEKCGG
ncbi:HNH endonuclease signature motif containing protein [Shouchella miscanthi]|uniref:HNH endonuclease signature motif containing protein n=1 Tax=Shouchella miscanthi TaxID=2598861 RepID=UPI0011AA2469|nr:HNH endonuclease [Shouchella miscanthi]